MKRCFFSLLFAFTAVFADWADQPGPVVIESPVGTECRTWMNGGVTYLKVVNTTDRAIAGTVTLNEIYEKVIPVAGRPVAAIDGRWIKIELPPEGEMVLRLGK